MRREAPGSIVMIGSMSGAAVNIPQPQAPYNASKAAVRHMASSLAVEWATKNIRVNVVSPGYMAVRSSTSSFPPLQPKSATDDRSLQTALTRVILDREPALKYAPSSSPFAALH